MVEKSIHALARAGRNEPPALENHGGDGKTR